VTLQARPGRESRAQGRPPAARRTSWFSWWVTPSVALAWRLPLFSAFALAGGWYLFRGLVRMAFMFDASALLSFLFAPLLLPLAALPAACFYFAVRLLPRIWRDARIGSGTKSLNTVVMLPASLVLAAFVDVIETSIMVAMRVPMPNVVQSLLSRQLPPGL
jgi:hypothetical protein